MPMPTIHTSTMEDITRAGSTVVITKMNTTMTNTTTREGLLVSTPRPDAEEIPKKTRKRSVILR